MRDAFPPPMCCVDCLRVSFGWLMSLGRSVRGCITEIGRDGLRMKRLMSLGRIVCKWFFCLCGIVWKNMMEFGRGGACVPARVALQGRIRRSSPAHNACIFGMETPLRGRSGGHTGAALTVSFGWIVYWRLVAFGRIACGTVDVVWVDCA